MHFVCLCNRCLLLVSWFCTACYCTLIHVPPPCFSLQSEGNALFSSGDHIAAMDRYTAALALPLSPDCRSFAAICFANRAATCQATGSLPDAIADCSRAIALNPEYAKVREVVTPRRWEERMPGFGGTVPVSMSCLLFCAFFCPLPFQPKSRPFPRPHPLQIWLRQR